MITTNEENFYTLNELSEQTNLCYKAVSVKLKRRNINFDFIKDKKKYYHSSAIEILKGKLKTYKTIYEKIYITETYHIYESKINYDLTI
jgi:arabinogalactan endo-1,4-beta-galactosidase